MSTQVAEVLEQALSAFGPNGENWVNHCPEDDSRTCCMLSALPDSITSSLFSSCEIELARAIGGKTDAVLRNNSISKWNDARGRTWPEVKAAYKKAIAAARRGTE